MALMSKEVLFPGDEITVNYGYKVTLFFGQEKCSGPGNCQDPTFSAAFCAALVPRAVV